MDAAIIFDNKSHNQNNLLTLTGFSDKSDTLPFPLNLNIFWRWLITAVLAAVFVQDVRLRLKIISFIRSPDTKLNETNILFCLDQINGLFLAIMLACGINFVVLTVPAAKLISPNVFYLNGTSHGLYVSGTITWRCFIAVYRALFIKAQKLLTGNIRVNNILAAMIGSGLVLKTGFSIISVTSDQYSYSRRNCNHWSDEALDIIKTYQALTENTMESEDPCPQCWLLFFSLLGFILIVVEFCCYIIIFHHIKVHNNDVMSGVLDKNVIKKRNLTNVISLSGLFICWLLEVFHITFAGFLAMVVGRYWNRVLSIYIRYIEFVLVPMVHIYTSPPIRRYLKADEH